MKHEPVSKDHPSISPAARRVAAVCDWFANLSPFGWLVIIVLGIVFCAAKDSTGSENNGVVGALLLLGVYFLPAYIGRKKRNAGAILTLNLFLGWTLIGWVVALVWAQTKEPEQLA